MHPTHLIVGVAVALYFLFQSSINIPNDILSYLILAWGVCIFLDLHSTWRTPSMMKYETNHLFSFLHKKLSWGSISLQIGVELCIIGAASQFFADQFQAFCLTCACTGLLHAWCWHKNEIFRQKHRQAEETFVKNVMNI